jgi:hypothetical protein
MKVIKETCFPDSPLIVPSPRNKRYLRKLIYILVGYGFTLLVFLFSEGFFAGVVVLLQVLVICSSLYTLYYGMFAFITACCLLNLGYLIINISKYHVILDFMLVVFFIYASYYSYIIYNQMKEQYSEQHSVAYKAFYQYM